MNPPTAPSANTHHLLLPDFCSQRAVLLILVIVALTGVLLALAGTGFSPQFWGDLARKLMFLLWTGLAGAALLCAVRRQIAARGALAGAFLVLGLVVALVAVVSELAWRVLNSPTFNPYSLLGAAPTGHWPFLARNLAIGAIVCAVALRYIYVAQQWRLNVEAQARARVDALQARIRPHFLYNSMNTIASLTRSDPTRAEDAVLDLADLFRASLDEKRVLVTLQEELDTARTYERIERLRLGDRLRVHWDVAAAPPGTLVPALTLQPLLENAIGHGIANLAAGGEVAIEGGTVGDMLLLSVRNPLPLGDTQDRNGHGIALENIRERLALLYGARASVAAGREGDEFVVRLRVPLAQATALAP
jgi:two-component system sensor histidine kinase AlgZ